jgi:hypothetical protein
MDWVFAVGLSAVFAGGIFSTIAAGYSDLISNYNSSVKHYREHAISTAVKMKIKPDLFRVRRRTWTILAALSYAVAFVILFWG